MQTLPPLHPPTPRPPGPPPSPPASTPPPPPASLEGSRFFTPPTSRKNKKEQTKTNKKDNTHTHKKRKSQPASGFCHLPGPWSSALRRTPIDAEAAPRPAGDGSVPAGLGLELAPGLGGGEAGGGRGQRNSHVRKTRHKKKINAKGNKRPRAHDPPQLFLAATWFSSKAQRIIFRATLASNSGLVGFQWLDYLAASPEC